MYVFTDFKAKKSQSSQLCDYGIIIIHHYHVQKADFYSIYWIVKLKKDRESNKIVNYTKFKKGV